MKTRITRNLAVGLGLAVAMSAFITGAASAHVVVKPASVGVAAYQTFTIGVPNEKTMPTVGVRVVIPEGVASVSPNVKPGWTIETKKTGEGEAAVVSEIIWTGGAIPEGQRDEFAFSAKTPAKPTTLKWKAYQTYEDGTVVAWDQAPVEKSETKEDANTPEPTPYSQTKVVDDVTDTAAATTETKDDSASTDTMTRSISFVALAIAVLALLMNSRNRTATIATRK